MPSLIAQLVDTWSMVTTKVSLISLCFTLAFYRMVHASSDCRTLLHIWSCADRDVSSLVENFVIRPNSSILNALLVKAIMRIVA